MQSAPEINFEALWQQLTSNFCGDTTYSIHGPAHWKRVERNGLFLAAQTKADITIVRLFALFHDYKRLNDGHDPDHGLRAAQFVRILNGTLFTLDDTRMDMVDYACTWHTHQEHSDDVTIGTCWDADRLDLGRVGIVPSPEFMSTTFGKAIAEAGSIESFLQQKSQPFVK